jgi:hypothetical protein
VTLLALYGMNVTLLSRSGSNVTLLSLLSLGSRRTYHSDRRHPANDQVIFRKSLETVGYAGGYGLSWVSMVSRRAASRSVALDQWAA